jgi:hypothetical protein
VVVNLHHGRQNEFGEHDKKENDLKLKADGEFRRTVVTKIYCSSWNGSWRLPGFSGRRLLP